MDDSPETALLNGYTRVAVAEEYRTYVMFKPDGGEWVPLQMIRWSWVGQADYKVGPPVGDQPGVLDWYLMAGLPLKGDLQPVFDHPVWDNVVAACSGCNLKKGNMTPDEAGMWPSQMPFQPSVQHLHRNGRLFPPNYLHDSWLDYLYWDTELEP